jgi:RNA polymerase sigma-70 factor (ECF subfamily)
MDANAIGALYQRTGHLVLRRASQMLRDPEEARDVAQWVFLRAMEVGFEHRSDPESLAWLYRAATQRCLHLLRTSGTRARLRVRHEDALRPPAPPDPEVDLGSRQVWAQLLSQVDERTGEIALATFSMGLSNERVAELFGVSVRTVGRARAEFEAVVQRQRHEVAS